MWLPGKEEWTVSIEIGAAAGGDDGIVSEAESGGAKIKSPELLCSTFGV